MLILLMDSNYITGNYWNYINKMLFNCLYLKIEKYITFEKKRIICIKCGKIQGFFDREISFFIQIANST